MSLKLLQGLIGHAVKSLIERQMPLIERPKPADRASIGIKIEKPRIIPHTLAIILGYLFRIY